MRAFVYHRGPLPAGSSEPNALSRPAVPPGSPASFRTHSSDVTVIKEYAVDGANATVVCVEGSIFDYDFDMIVNAANTSGLGGRGIDLKFIEKGGNSLKAARKKHMKVVSGRKLEVGGAYLTQTPEATGLFGSLKAKKGIIHAVGPKCTEEQVLEAAQAQLLTDAYRNSLGIVRSHGNCSSVAFPVLSGERFAPSGPSGKLDVRKQALIALRNADTCGPPGKTHLYVYLVELPLNINKKGRLPGNEGGWGHLRDACAAINNRVGCVRFDNVHAGMAVQEEDIISNALMWLVNPINPDAPEIPKYKPDRYRYVSYPEVQAVWDKWFAIHLHNRWGMVDHKTDTYEAEGGDLANKDGPPDWQTTIQGVDFYEGTSEESYAKAWVVKDVQLTQNLYAKGKAIGYGDSGKSAHLVFVAAPCANKKHGTSTLPQYDLQWRSQRRTYDDSARRNYGYFKKCVTAAVRCGINTAIENGCTQVIVPYIGCGIYAGRHKKRIIAEFETIVDSIAADCIGTRIVCIRFEKASPRVVESTPKTPNLTIVEGDCASYVHTTDAADRVTAVLVAANAGRPGGNTGDAMAPLKKQLLDALGRHTGPIILEEDEMRHAGTRPVLKGAAWFLQFHATSNEGEIEVPAHRWKAHFSAPPKKVAERRKILAQELEAMCKIAGTSLKAAVSRDSTFTLRRDQVDTLITALAIANKKEGGSHG